MPFIFKSKETKVFKVLKIVVAKELILKSGARNDPPGWKLMTLMVLPAACFFNSNFIASGT